MTLEAQEVAACTKLLALKPSDRLVVLDYLLALKRESVNVVNENNLLKDSWELPRDAKIIDAKPNEVLVDAWSGSRRRMSMACPKERDSLLADIAGLVSLLHPMSFIGFNAASAWPDDTLIASQWTTGFGKITVGDCRAAGRAVKEHQAGEKKT